MTIWAAKKPHRAPDIPRRKAGPRHHKIGLDRHDISGVAEIVMQNAYFQSARSKRNGVLSTVGAAFPGSAILHKGICI